VATSWPLGASASHAQIRPAPPFAHETRTFGLPTAERRQFETRSRCHAWASDTRPRARWFQRQPVELPSLEDLLMIAIGGRVRTLPRRGRELAAPFRGPIMARGICNAAPPVFPASHVRPGRRRRLWATGQCNCTSQSGFLTAGQRIITQASLPLGAGRRRRKTILPPFAKFSPGPRKCQGRLRGHLARRCREARPC